MENVDIQLINIDAKKPHLHSGIECILVIKGFIKIFVDDCLHLLHQDDLIVINRNTIYSVEGNSSNIVLSLNIDIEAIEKICGSLCAYEINCILKGDNKEDKAAYEIKSLLGKILIDYINKHEGNKLNFNMNLVRLLYLFYMNYRGEKIEDEKSLGVDENSTILNIVKYINENYKNSLNLKILAEREYISPAYLSTVFKRKMGIGFLAYIQDIRIENALKDLLHTNDSILKIALQNGFTNEKSFSNAFKKKYNQTPGQYRSKFKVSKEDKIGDKQRQLYDLASEDSNVMEFLKYITRYELFEMHEDRQNLKDYVINADNSNICRLDERESFVMLKNMSDIFDPDNRERLLQVQSKLGVNIVYFPLEYRDMVVNYENFDTYYDMYRALEFLECNEFSPFISIRMAPEFNDLTSEVLHKTLKSYLDPIFMSIDKCFSQKYMFTWLYEIIPFKDASFEQSVCFYTTVYDCIRAYNTKSKIGLFSVDDLTSEKVNRFSEIIDYVVQLQKVPDFLTFNAFANIKRRKAPFEDMYYPELKNLYNKIVGEITGIYLEKCGKAVPMYMTVWSTIASNMINADNSYFRTALILDSLIYISDSVKAVGFWLDTSMCSILDDKIDISMLALYVFKKAARPVYAMLEALKRLGKELIYFGDNCLAAVNEYEELIILLWNPIYLNPIYSMENKITIPHKLTAKITIKNLKEKNYYIKRFTYNYANSGVMGKSMIAGFPNDWRDKDVLEYLMTSAGRDLHITEQTSGKEGEIFLSANIDFNGAVMYIISLR